ncbi:hypothetical protein ACWDSD_18130 [Streptomyces spiralis]
MAAQTKLGDPKAAAAALLKVVDAEQPPLRVLSGVAPTHMVKNLYAERLQTWADWEQVSRRRRRRLTPPGADGEQIAVAADGDLLPPGLRS